MSEPSEEQLTRLLRRWSEGDESAFEELFPLVYHSLKRLAHQLFRMEHSGHTLQTTALVHEAWMRLSSASEVQWNGRAHFFGAAATAMRRVLVDHARACNAIKRGENPVLVPLDQVRIAFEPNLDVIALDSALDDLAAFDPERARMVELRYFAGLSIEETAAVLESSAATVKRDWAATRAWLYRRMQA